MLQKTQALTLLIKKYSCGAQVLSSPCPPGGKWLFFFSSHSHLISWQNQKVHTDKMGTGVLKKWKSEKNLFFHKTLMHFGTTEIAFSDAFKNASGRLITSNMSPVFKSYKVLPSQTFTTKFGILIPFKKFLDLYCKISIGRFNCISR